MKDCERQFGVLGCSKLGDGICALALNDAWPGGGNPQDPEVVQSLVNRGFTYCAIVYIAHSVDKITNPKVREFLLGCGYDKCELKHVIAEKARKALEILTEDKALSPDSMAGIIYWYFRN
ncbi:hypothetical protein A2875_03360 [Candidatus Gottesmanbacteria bacterium RIFCSPHIGHO2_01_FULL_46_14]|uniref:Uncharacterized protein n=2 Tax=Candidatus Gottesmaniibacteriota TaxID=1752720 RepID=A0A1F5ZQD8_9BACT|nr:MAG: hypothetical protein UY08_C0005G0016 [Candidatus Gottesmanbacteria bacterium GW2011_GWA1_47_8]OGG14534.1 MAG: hypothetical protein A2875_03360 [Candidatus Gottesmanbacteria bacterium RIFCSPHIGHO2_01_FULL_46_14]